MLLSRTKGPKTIRHHRKCRTGCLECKRRKIKCGEQKPACSQCYRASSNCVYLIEMSPSAKLVSERFQQSSLTDKTAGILAAGTSALGCVPSFTLVHMELLHTWSTVTGGTASRSPEKQAVWKTMVTSIALQHDFLLSSLLAFTARHLSRLRPSQQSYYEDLATRLQSGALRSLNNGRLLLHMSKDTSEPVFLFSSFTWMNAVATPCKTPGGHPLSACRDWLIFLRGVASVVMHAWPWLAMWNLLPLLLPNLTWEYSKTPPAEEPLKHLQSLILSVEDLEKRQIYTKAAKDLEVAFARLHYLSKESCSLMDLFQWPARLADRYVELLMDSEAEALVIFAHYAVLISRESSSWWLEGRAEWIISSIYAHLAPRHRPWMDWPMQQIS